MAIKLVLRSHEQVRDTGKILPTPSDRYHFVSEDEQYYQSLIDHQTA